MVVERKSAVAYFSLDRDADRKALAALRDREAQGEVEIDMITWPPQLDHKGVAKVSAFYWEKRLLTQSEIDTLEDTTLQNLNKNIAKDPVAEKRSDQVSPGPLPGLTLTAEEKELLAPWRGRPDDH